MGGLFEAKVSSTVAILYLLKIQLLQIKNRRISSKNCLNLGCILSTTPFASLKTPESPDHKQDTTFQEKN